MEVPAGHRSLHQQLPRIEPIGICFMGGFIHLRGIVIQMPMILIHKCVVCLVHGGKRVLHALEEVFLDGLAAAAGADIADTDTSL